MTDHKRDVPQTITPAVDDGGFRRELTDAINRHSRENRSDTPDFILAEYLARCLDAFDLATRDRVHWFRESDDDKDKDGSTSVAIAD